MVKDGSKLCDNEVVFNNEAHSVLFTNSVRLRQCSVPNDCLINVCAPEMGWEASFSYSAEEDQYVHVVDLLQTGVLVCDPAVYPGNPLGCLGVPVEPMCPCT